MITYVVVAILAVVVFGVACQKFRKTFLIYRGARLVPCPETRQPAAVQLEAWHAALTGIFRRPALRVRTCSRWPERTSCGQSCVQQILAAPSEHRLPAILEEWCHNRPCVCCGAPIACVHVGPHQPHLMSPDQRIIEWNQVPPQELPQVLSTCAPVCETCLTAETHSW